MNKNDKYKNQNEHFKSVQGPKCAKAKTKLVFKPKLYIVVIF